MQCGNAFTKLRYDGMNVFIGEVGRGLPGQSGHLLLEVFEGLLIVSPRGFPDGEQGVEFCAQVGARLPNLQLASELVEFLTN